MKVIGAISAHALLCDVPGCDSAFYTYSMHPLIRRQARAEAWQRLTRATVSRRLGIEQEQLRGKRLDVCPQHTERAP